MIERPCRIDPVCRIQLGSAEKGDRQHAGECAADHRVDQEPPAGDQDHQGAYAECQYGCGKGAQVGQHRAAEKECRDEQGDVSETNPSLKGISFDGSPFQHDFISHGDSTREKETEQKIFNTDLCTGQGYG